MGRFTTEAKVGLVVIIAVLLLTFLTFRVGEFTFIKEKGYRIYALFDSAAGLDTKSQVSLAGVGVGKVEGIDLVDNRAKITMLIRPDVKLRKGAKASIRATGLLGEKYLEIITGKETGILNDGDTIEASGEAADVDRLVNQLSSVAEDIKAVTSALKGSFGTEEGAESVKEIMSNFRDLSKNLNLLIGSNRDSLGKSISNFEEFSRLLKEDGPKLIKALNNITGKIERGEGTLGKLVSDEGLYKRLDSSLENISMITGKIANGEGTLGRLATDDGVYKKLDATLGRLEKGEGTIGRLLTDETAYENLNSALEGLGNVVSRIERFKTIVGFRNEYQFDQDENKGYFSVQLQPRQDKFYLLEVVDDPRGEVTKTTRTTTVNGVSNTTEDLNIKRRLKVSALLGRRFSDIALRIGLMENTFGLGADLYLFDDNFRVSLEAWDFNSDDPESEKVHLKATASYTFFKYLFVQGGYDNIANEKVDTIFLGGGLKFDDEDLKYMLMGSSLKFK
ncbi:MAG TPA: MlaD family protein [Nitrospiria bacterium]|nr:MlaD family protein [Nitrospiria bacterium]